METTGSLHAVHNFLNGHKLCDNLLYVLRTCGTKTLGIRDLTWQR
jgi:hypothetical protein